MDIENRFWSKVNKTIGGCWLWNASRFHDGYGQFKLRGKQARSHRVAYELMTGPIPAEMELDHLCRVRCCVNPSHLEPVTKRENVRRGFGQGGLKAAQTHCESGHAFDTLNTYIRRGGTRGCRACNREAVRRYKARKKSA